MHVSLKMLFGDRAKFVSLIVGLAFAVLLIAQQGAFFLGLMQMATGPLQNVVQPDIWVANKHTRYVFEVRPMNEKSLPQVRSVQGVAWAEPFLSSRVQLEMPSGEFKAVQMIGIDRNTLVGQPWEMLEGSLDDLRAPDAVVVEDSSRAKLGNVRIGDTLKLNDRRAVVVGVCRAKLGWESNALVYTTYDNALSFAPVGRDRLPFILVKTKPGEDVENVARAIEIATGLGAFPTRVMAWNTIDYILRETGIGLNFGFTVLLGFIVGLVVVAAIFHQFVLENIRNFAVLKAMGASSARLIAMVLLQAVVVGGIGFGIGSGLAGMFAISTRKPGSTLTAHFPWQLLLICFGSMLLCVGLGSVLSLRRVLRLEPAVVFK